MHAIEDVIYGIVNLVNLCTQTISSCPCVDNNGTQVCYVMYEERESHYLCLS